MPLLTQRQIPAYDVLLNLAATFEGSARLDRAEVVARLRQAAIELPVEETELTRFRNSLLACARLMELVSNDLNQIRYDASRFIHVEQLPTLEMRVTRYQLAGTELVEAGTELVESLRGLAERVEQADGGT
jgi:hypothetical protein